MAKYLIINADDYGMSREANEAITDLLLKKRISSTSMMANGVCFDEAAGLAHMHHIKDIGVHLALTRDGFQTDTPLRYSSLSGTDSITKDGFLYTCRKDLEENCLFKDLVKECRMQYHKLLENGVDFTHVDNHMYTLFPGLGLKGYLSALIAYDGQCSRKRRGIRFAKEGIQLEGFYEVWGGRKVRTLITPLLKIKNLVSVDRVYSFPYSSCTFQTTEDAIAYLERFLAQVPEGITELHVHPCSESDAIKKWNPTWKQRVREYDMLLKAPLEEMLNKYHIEMTTYRELCEK